EGEGDELRIVATDSYRLAVRVLGAQGVDATRVLVPSRAVAEVARLCPGKEVRVELSSSQIGFHVEDAFVQSRLIEGEFPAYRQLLPEQLPNELRIEKADPQRPALIHAPDDRQYLYLLMPIRVS